MIQYFKQILFLLDEDRKKIPWLIILFLLSSVLDLVGLGLIGPYVVLIISPNSLNEGLLYDLVVFFDFTFEQEVLLNWLGLILMGVFLFKACLAIFINKTIISFSNNQSVRLKSYLMNAYLLMPYNDYLRRNSAEYIQSIQSFTSGYSAVVNTCLKTICDGIVAAGIFTMLALTSGPALGLLVFLLGGMVFGFDRLFRKKVGVYGKIVSEAGIKMTKGIHEGIEGLKEIRILGKEQHFHQIVVDGAKETAKYVIKRQLISTAPRFFLEFLLVVFIVTLVAVFLRLGQNLQVLAPILGMFGFAALRLMPAANSISTSLIEIRFNRHAISMLFNDIVSLKNSDQAKIRTTPPLKNVTHFRNLTFHNVCFTYVNSENPALNKIDIEIREGESVGLIGPSGSGKTTMLDVLLGLLVPQGGKINYNGKPLNESLDKWRSQVAYLPQQVFLTDNSLRHNIALGLKDEDINYMQLHKAIHQARLQVLVGELPNGVETMIGERGVRLSGGQRQRVALARAFYHNRSVLIMDEATSSLDNETEEEIIDEIKLLKGKKTVIVIAHRLSTVQHCDRIYRLENAEISDSGTLNQVLTNKAAKVKTT